jgi:YggT family protein
VNAVRAGIHIALSLFLALLFARMIFDWLQFADRKWRPTGPMLVFAELTYTITDPPIRGMNKVIPPLKLGAARLDVGFTVLVLGVWLLLRFF